MNDYIIGSWWIEYIFIFVIALFFLKRFFKKILSSRKLKVIEIEGINGFPVVEIKEIQDFLAIAKRNKLDVFKLQTRIPNGKETLFIIMGSVMYQAPLIP